MSFALRSALLALALPANLAAAAVLSGFTPERQDRFACRVSSALTKSLSAKNQTYRQALKAIRASLRTDVARWSDVMIFNQPIIGTSQLFFRSYDYYLQNAFINVAGIDARQLKDENWFGAYVFLSAKTETEYRRHEIPKYNLAADPKLLEKVRPYVAESTGLRWPVYEKSATYNCRREWWYGDICSATDARPLGDPDHPAYGEWVRQAQAANLIATPLFLWMVGQPLNSITYEALFDRAVAEYQDPIVAIGVIAWLFMVDSQMGSRTRGGVVASRVEPVVYSGDRAGDAYHFWGYMMKSMVGERLKYEAMAFANEIILQRDQSDWQVDRMAFAVGAKITERLARPDLCAEK